MKKFAMFAFIALMGALVAVPAMAAPKALSEAEMDAVTAAGQPEVLISGTVGTEGAGSSPGGGPVFFGGTDNGTLTIGTGGQNDLRALVLNNVVGENQLATALNVTSVAASSNQAQANTIAQSWGSTLDLALLKGSSTSTAIAGKCVGVGNVCASASSQPTTRQSAYGDEIIIGNTISKTPYKQFDMTIVGQANLSALAVNNVLGMNQAGTAMNIMGGGANITGGAGSTLELLPIAVGGVTASGQTNSITQYRGTPLTRP